MKYLVLITLLSQGCQEAPQPENKPTLPKAPLIEPKAPDPIPEPEPVVKYDEDLAAYQTPVKVTEGGNREHNIKLGAEKLNGLILQPGEKFSFNEVVGKRSKENGFKEAPVIWEGVVVPGLGGGMCQVSSTLHAALLHAGIEPTQRSHHSRPSSYIDIGIDAAVSWPDICETDPPKCIKLDLKFENTYDFPIQLDARYVDYPQGDLSFDPPPPPYDSLIITIWGSKASTKEVSLRERWHWTEDFEIVEKKKGWGSRRTQLQKGKKGKSATLYITTKDLATGEFSVRKLHSRYKPTNEVWETGPDYVPPVEEEPSED